MQSIVDTAEGRSRFMRLTVSELCALIERSVPHAHCRPVPNILQISATFDYRPDKVVLLLTPYLQSCMKRGGIPDDDLQRLIEDVRDIATFRVL